MKCNNMEYKVIKCNYKRLRKRVILQENVDIVERKKLWLRLLINIHSKN